MACPSLSQCHCCRGQQRAGRQGQWRLKDNCLTLPGGEAAVGLRSGGCNHCVNVSVALLGRRRSARGVGCVDHYRNQLEHL